MATAAIDPAAVGLAADGVAAARAALQALVSRDSPVQPTELTAVISNLLKAETDLRSLLV